MTWLLDQINIALIVVTCVNFLLALAILLNDSKQKINRAYSLITLAIISWVVAMIFYRSAPSELALFAGTLLYVSATLIASTFLYFTYIFPSEKDTHITLKSTFIFLVNGILIGMIIWPDFIIQAVNIRAGAEKEIIFTDYYWFYFFYIFSFFSYGFMRLSAKYRQSSGIERQQVLYVLSGYAITGNLAFITNLIMPWFGFFYLNWIGQLFTTIIVGCTSYAILKHHLFSIKVIVTEILTFTLSLIALLQIFISDGTEEIIIRTGIFIVVLIVGLLLIRSVIKEVRLREEVQGLVKDLKLSNEQQSNLIHFISHEVKGFLGKSRNIFSLFLEGEYGPLPDYLKIPSEEGLNSGTKGVEMVMEILNASNFKKGTVEYKKEPFDLKQVLFEILADQKKIAEAKGLHFESHIEESDNYTMVGDSEQIRHALKNLLDNSIKYTPKGTIGVYFSKKEKMICFSVKDTGVGINPVDIPHLFTEGMRGTDALKVNVDSTGYGLFIVKKIVEAHGGKIWFQSEGVGKGSTFFIEFPIN
jgi:signal transduction histidine kinase